ncbi:hypothetical protein MIND_00616400 [Mycena indigotica]|uniref:Uncharacterized protein n=1 Tax=Mycena indigotica TaxID=2126181 RepID=A0A8H6STY1_9AGAR|nr:uncharacterized protein MIND_00616400 [Mycena indigotica]KAF7303865.1 hypothetical protein MIND_00616400 [Mycena indigotica]
MSRKTSSSNLPPKREGPPLRPVSAPLSSTRLNRLIYLLLIISTLLSAYYGYRVLQWKTQVGGWWNLATGQRPEQIKTTTHTKGRGGESVEERINALADALGMPSRDLASAIAGAVKQYVPPATLSSIAAHQTGPAVEAMMKENGEKTPSSNEEQSSGGVVDNIASGMGSFVGMDEP